jgi:two-component system OmpR family response regulator
MVIATMNRRAVLLIEDEYSISDALSAALRQEGFDVRVAAGAEAGLESFKSRPPDLVLLDVMPPDGRQ